MLDTMNQADAFFQSLDNALRAVSGGAHAARPCPRPQAADPPQPLSAQDSRLSVALMRVNHVGEVCAQALYQAQALTARSPAQRASMLAAARDEMDHLAWTQQRLDDLGGRTSLLNPLWYAGAFAIGLAAGRAGDAVSLGFLVETERQVEQHLASHLDRLPAQDQASRAIVEQMKTDEARHADEAQAAGAATMPAPVRWLMRTAARVMTGTAHHI
jgi:3-demethoxyubiquinol 3-hydroxylase